MIGVCVRFGDECRHGQPAGDEVFFLALAQSFYATLEARRCSPVTSRAFEHELERLPASQVLGAAAAKPMLVDAPAHIIRDTGVKTAVGAAQDVQAESVHDRFLNTRFVGGGSGIAAGQCLAKNPKRASFDTGHIFRRISKCQHDVRCAVQLLGRLV